MHHAGDQLSEVFASNSHAHTVGGSNHDLQDHVDGTLAFAVRPELCSLGGLPTATATTTPIWALSTWATP
ncbi:hypothetical protein NUW54_g10452 [Trametes sanguinea]|uniref:Uncharacterized protein n=1 Tax=Trametes sanguinea TaxID=158606 RepID=A0ACC1NZ24_9APHY|nr:hypothetical protein NUW54_g10452 [Trametes sanguinea]